MECDTALFLSRIIRLFHGGGDGLIVLLLVLAIHLVIIDIRTGTQ